jgi:hypothetical protein
MLEYRSPQRIYFTLISAGVALGMALTQLILVLTGRTEYSNTAIVFPALVSLFLLPFGWRMVASLPWGTINDPARYEYRNPYGPSEAVSDGGEKDSRSNPSQNPAAPEDLKS